MMLNIHYFNDKFIGIKQSPIYKIDNRSLFICVDNTGFQNDTFPSFINLMTQILYALNDFIDYKKVTLIYNYPKITCVTGDVDTIYNKIVKLVTKRGCDKNASEGLDEMIKMIENPMLSDVVIITYKKICNEDWEKKLSQIENMEYIYIYFDGVQNFDHKNNKSHKIDNDNINTLCLSNILKNDIEQLYYININFSKYLPKQYGIVEYHTFGDIKMYTFGHYLLLPISMADSITKFNVVNEYIPSPYDKFIFVNLMLEHIHTNISPETFNDYDDVIIEMKTEKHGDKYMGKNILNKLRNINSEQMQYMRPKNKIKSDFNDLIDQLVSMLKSNIDNKRVQNKVFENMMKHIDVDDEKNIVIEHDVKNIDIGSIEKSRDLYYSVITLSDWYDEIVLGNSFGLLVEMNLKNEYVILGIKKMVPEVSNITMTFMSSRDYLESVINHLIKTKSTDVSNQHIIMGCNIVGSGNMIIPLYICKTHWKIAHEQLKSILGIVISNNPYSYNGNYMNYIYCVLIKMIHFIMNENHQNLSEKCIMTFYGVLRTCAQISYEYGYHDGIKILIKKYIKNNKVDINYEIIFGQIISTGSNLTDDKFRIIFDCIYKQNLIQGLKRYWRINKKIDIDVVNIVLQSPDIVAFCDTMSSIYKMIHILKQMFANIGGFKKWLDIIDSNFGVANLEMLKIKDDIVKINMSNSVKNHYSAIGFDEKYKDNLVIYLMNYYEKNADKQNDENIEKKEQEFENYGI